MRRVIAALLLAFASASCSPPQHEAVRQEEAPSVAGAEPETAAMVETRRPERASQSGASGADSGGYQYIDETGHVRIAASLAEVPERQRSTATGLANRKAPSRARSRGAEAEEPVGSAQRADVTIYTTPGCGWCRRAMAYFDKKGVDYTNRDISADREAYDDYLNVTGGEQGVPVIVVGEDWMQGWNQGHFDELLAKAN